MEDMRFATLRLGKTSVDEIKRMDKSSPGIVATDFNISVKCTQVPPDLNSGTYVFIWLGSDNSKGIQTEWKQGFKSIGAVSSVVRAEKYNDESTILVSIKYIFQNAVSRLDVLKDAPAEYYWCSALPIIGIDDHSNQTVRMFTPDSERCSTEAFLCALNITETNLKESLCSIDSRFAHLFNFSTKRTNGNPEAAQQQISRKTGAENILLYGVPGAGKSHYIKSHFCTDASKMERVVFHPDYSYSDFVGQILPKVEDGVLRYLYSPGPFTKILKKAWQDPQNYYYLVVEELNRGNAPAIFGEIFQLLDRKADTEAYPDCYGESEYGISNSDVANEVSGNPDAMVFIPSNLWIIATMNTADQNVFTLDTAFQRRWMMKHIENDVMSAKHANDKIEGSLISWGVFATVINEEILKVSDGVLSSEDKRLGAYFITKQELSTERFPEKVLKYLWDDAFKINRDSLFAAECNSFDAVTAMYRSKSDKDPLSQIINQSVYTEMLNRMNNLA